MNCRACGKSLPKKVNQVPSYFGETSFLISRCDCGCSQINNHYSFLDDNIYDIIYSDPDVYGYGRYLEYHNYIQDTNFPLKYLSKIEDTYYGIIKSIKKHLNEKSSILEIGSGLGYTTYALRKSGYKAVGFDISKESVNKANNKFGQFFRCVDVFEAKVNSNEVYDAIICSEVIEHIDNPLEFLKNCYKYLKPNGVFILTTPNRTDYSENVIWKSSLPPVHISFFDKNSLDILVNRTGAKILEFTSINEFYWKNPEFDYNSNSYKIYSKGDDQHIIIKSRFRILMRFLARIPYLGFSLLCLFSLIRRNIVLFGKNNSSKVIIAIIKK